MAPAGPRRSADPPTADEPQLRASNGRASPGDAPRAVVLDEVGRLPKLRSLQDIEGLIDIDAVLAPVSVRGPTSSRSPKSVRGPDALWSIPPGGFDLIEEPEPGDEIAGATLVSLLGSGMGLVCWRGQLPDGSSVTVHTLEPGASRPMRAHFLAKAADLQQRLQEHPIDGVLRILAVDPLECGYVGAADAMATAADLPDIPVTLDQQVQLLREICLILGRLHEAGLTHGCLRPEAVLIDHDQRPLVANVQAVDIAAACRQDPAAAVARSSYAAPEVRTGTEVDARADVFSVGRLIHYLLLGSDPEDTDEDLPTLASLSEAPSGLVRIVRRCTARDPADRYPNAMSVVADLDRWIEGGEVGVGHPDVVERYDLARHALALRRRQAERPLPAPMPRVDVAPQQKQAPARPAHEMPAQEKQPPPAQTLEPTQISRPRWAVLAPAAFVTLGLGMIGGAALASYRAGAALLWAEALCIAGAAVSSLALPRFGRRPALSRALWTVALVLIVALVRPAELAARAGDAAHRLALADPAQKASMIRSLRAQGRSDLAGLDLSAADLRGIDLRGVVLDGTTLKGAKCAGIDFEGASLLNVDVAEADLTGARLPDVNLTQLVGWEASVCDEKTVMPPGWTCQQGHPWSPGAKDE